MLDKSVPFIDILMVRQRGTPVPEPQLPEPYSFRAFREGDERDWARIETSVLEFDAETAALQYFRRNLLPYLAELERRCLFVTDGSGEKIATCTAWWGYTGVRREPMLHWLAVMPGHQGKRIGKALAAKITSMLCEIEGDRDFYLHTQTWSHKAVRLYEKLGYRITARNGVCGYANRETERAVSVLKKLYPNWKAYTVN